MITINNYYHKPTQTVLKMGRDFDTATENTLVKYKATGNPDMPYIAMHLYLKSDCRPLATVEINGQSWTDGDIAKSYDGYYFLLAFNEYRFVVYSEVTTKYIHTSATQDYMNNCDNDGSYFDNPDQYPFAIEEVLRVLNVIV